MAEKRWYSRYPVSLSGGLAKSHFMIKVELLDLSIEGARIRTDTDRLKVGDKVKLSIHTKPPIKVEGEVRWCRKTPRGIEAGIHFTNMDFKYRQHLQSLISQIALSSTPDAYFR
ncbi:MAG TPA: PilZ domain-containing protein [Thermosulfurimonas dismutans]|uniref:PilZ domain-containing protein n=1 Tax=Thermosulfurimonas dismutans TaxID=999894 RepID=A0A7C3CTL0_9BACT|nr:PilZ domain-containing protein [Thermosulfurimonas sp.]HFC98093.1 PilZ domain-containing protein [Thermosulfurimonas dismutans]